YARQVAQAAGDVGDHEDHGEGKEVEGEGDAERIGDRALAPPADDAGWQATPDVAADDADADEPDRLEETPQREVPGHAVRHAAEGHRHDLSGRNGEAIAPGAGHAHDAAGHRNEQVGTQPMG